MKYYKYKFTWCSHSWILTSVQSNIENVKIAALAWAANMIDPAKIEFIEETEKYENPTDGD